ncbi:hypothetical protein CARUB_v10028066mg [Capsella rubella]|uniref:Pectinesterase inhibitor domain-containing protein n=2 Tax=Capsella rubella TaxID=81985 RepID=R0GU98_9BRAS|nr:hypothetical protein CARUB_v10028066mg [Capsella rubella]
MASSSYCFGVVSVSLAVLLPFLLHSASATSYIDALCHSNPDKAFCVKTLSAYPPVASATSKFQAAVATLALGESYANKTAEFAGKAAKEDPKLKKHLAACQDEFVDISGALKFAALHLKEDPLDANYTVMRCYDSTTIVTDLIGKNTDKASKTVTAMTMMLDKYIALGVGATVAVGG